MPERLTPGAAGDNPYLYSHLSTGCRQAGQSPRKAQPRCPEQGGVSLGVHPDGDLSLLTLPAGLARSRSSRNDLPGRLMLPLGRYRQLL